jgi:chorismate synthase
MAIESDRVEILGGMISGQTIGAPVVLRIVNRDWENWKDRWESGDLEPLAVPRPGHADYAGTVKHALDDARPILERASARETAARVAVGAMAKQLLEHYGITIFSYVSAIGGVSAEIEDIPPEALHQRAEESPVRCPDDAASQQMMAAIDRTREAGDSLGGLFTVVATGVPVGLGSHAQWDRRLDGCLASAMMSIPAIKGVEIGEAFGNAERRGTQVHDTFRPKTSPGVQRVSNRAGGLEGGMTNGEPVVLRAAMKPIPSTITPQMSVDLRTGEAAETAYQRSDVCAVPAASVVGEAMVAWTLASALRDKLGGDSLAEMTAHWKAWCDHA